MQQVYYIDGYNLLFRLLGTGINLAEERQRLIEVLNQKAEFLDIDITIVFDSQSQESDGSKTHFKNIEILFSAPDQTADDLILDEIKSHKNPRHITVVTSDKKLAWFARRCEAKTEAVEQFYTWLEKRFKNKLRQLKEFRALPKRQPVVKKAVKPKSLIPEKATPAENCSDYYLEAFQKRFDEIRKEMPSPEEPKPRKKIVKKKKSKKPPKSDQERAISDMDRWESIFETRLQDTP